MLTTPSKHEPELYSDYVRSCEQFVVGRALLNPTYFTSSGIRAEYFYDGKLSTIWEIIEQLTLAGVEVTEVTVSAELDRQDRLKYVGGSTYLYQLTLIDGPPSSAPDILRNAWLVREATMLSSDVPLMLRQGLSGDEILSRLASRIDELVTGNAREVTSLHTAATTELARARADYEVVSTGGSLHVGLPSGLGLETYVPGGIPRDKLTFIFGETGTYKTAIKQNIIDAIALANVGTVLDFSLEDSIELTTQRFLARISGVPYGRIATREFRPGDLAAIDDAFPSAEAAARRVKVVGDVPGSIGEALRLVQQHKSQGLAAVFLDYVQLMSTDPEEIYEICRKAQRSAKADKVAWIIVSQVKQDVSEREDHRPKLNDVFGSSGMKHTAKLAVGVYRPANYVEVPGSKSRYHELYHNHPDGHELYGNILEILIRKNVVGETGVTIPLLVDRTTGRISEFNL